MSKYKVGDKVVVEVYDAGNGYTLFDYCTAEPLSAYTEPLEAKIRRQAAEITRLLAENKKLKAENEKMLVKIDAYELYDDQHEEEYNQAFNQGAEAAWKLAQKITKFQLDGGYSIDELKAIFGHPHINEIIDLTYTEAAAKVAEWEKTKEKVKVGDVLEYIASSKIKCVVINICPNNMAYSVFNDGSTGIHKLENMKKTGRHIDIDSFLKQMGGEKNE